MLKTIHYSGECTTTKDFLEKNNFIINITSIIQNIYPINQDNINIKIEHYSHYDQSLMITLHMYNHLNNSTCINTSYAQQEYHNYIISEKINDLFNLYIIPVFILPNIYVTNAVNNSSNTKISDILSKITTTLHYVGDIVDSKENNVPTDQIITCIKQKSIGIIDNTYITLANISVSQLLGCNISLNDNTAFSCIIKINPSLILNAANYVQKYNIDYITYNLQLNQILKAYNKIISDTYLYTKTYNTALTLYRNIILPHQINTCIMTDIKNTNIPQIVTQQQYQSNVTFHELDIKHLQSLPPILYFALRSKNIKPHKHNYTIIPTKAAYEVNADADLLNNLIQYIDFLTKNHLPHYTIKFKILSSGYKFKLSNNADLKTFINNAYKKSLAQHKMINILELMDSSSFIITVMKNAVACSTKLQSASYKTNNTLPTTSQQSNDGSITQLTPTNNYYKKIFSITNIYKVLYRMKISTFTQSQPIDTLSISQQLDLIDREQCALGNIVHTSHNTNNPIYTKQETYHLHEKQENTPHRDHNMSASEETLITRSQSITDKKNIKKHTIITIAFISSVVLANILYYSYISTHYITNITHRKSADIIFAIGSLFLILFTICAQLAVNYKKQYLNQEYDFFQNHLTDVSTSAPHYPIFEVL
ncbi:hypothetical protein HL033_01670 [Neoehrlichia mikurensis]|uniref:hypothetical protein n=1 Tax=Neoehrlichia mikurensis TaxID=89586 RepID=UPI001C48CA16|nr:hypothetical protein [Neoehrlichia mikurensis]QXK92247.1 hypothetical protein IAH97_01665 [Neoehrlichia mikurensis]QXK92702.1 hypothetical protein HUN61_01660 [Neoehrlichia mikurensis]QXK93940.1 hypothetical protein HL033_01670 [Neoehrlichia mikurensis]